MAWLQGCNASCRRLRRHPPADWRDKRGGVEFSESYVYTPSTMWSWSSSYITSTAHFCLISAGMLQGNIGGKKTKPATTASTNGRTANRRLGGVLVFTWRRRLSFTFEVDILGDHTNCLDKWVKKNAKHWRDVRCKDVRIMNTVWQIYSTVQQLKC